MFRAKFLMGCVFIVAGMAWPTVSITRGLTTYSEVYRSALRDRREVQTSQKGEVIAALEQGSSSIFGGLLIGLFGMGLALGEKRNPVVAPDVMPANERA